MDHNTRNCGECTLCCRGTLTVKINEHKVYPEHPCPYVTNCGCGIYTDPCRPTVCESYKCMWLCELGLPDHLRPDKCGFILTGKGNYVLLTANFDGIVNGSALLEVIEICKKSNLTIFYTVKSSSENNEYIRGSILNHPKSSYKIGSMNAIFEPSELLQNE